MKNFISIIKDVFNREIKFIIKDINILTIILLAPLFYPFFYGSIYWNKAESDVKIVVVDLDRTEYTRELIRKLDSHQMLEVVGTCGDYGKGIESINNTDAQGMILFPQDFTADIKQGKGSLLKTYLNTSRFLVSNDINKAVTSVVSDETTSLRMEFFKMAGYNSDQAEELVEPVQSEIRPLFSYTESYGDFLIPGMLVLILQQTLLIGLSESMAKEREKNSLPGLFSTAQNNIFGAIAGKSILYFILFFAYACFFFTFHFYLFKINFVGSALTLAIFTLLLFISIIFISLFISSFFEKKILSLQIFAFTSYPVFLISGYSWPIESMPKFMQGLAYIIPSTPYLNAFTRITQMGAGISELLPQFIHLLLLTVTGFALTYWRMHKLRNQSVFDEHLFNKTQIGG